MKLTDKNTTFALNGNFIKDQSGSKISLTNTGVTVSQTQTKNFKNALYFNGSSYLTLDSTNLIPTTGDWTVDWWEWRDSSQTSGGAVFHQNYGSRTGYGLLLGYMNANNNLAYAGNNGAWNIFSGISCGAMQYGQWCHYAVVRSGSTFYTFQNGVQIATATSTASMMTSTQKIQIGIYDYSTSTYFKGYIDSLRVSNVARWTSAFTPPEYETEMNVKTNNGWVDAQKTYVKTANNTWSEGKSTFIKVAENLTILDYIESTGTQFIDTGFVPNNNTRVVVDFEILSQPINVYYTIFASRSNVYEQEFCIFSENNTATPNTTLSSYGSGTEKDIVLQYSLIGKRNVIDKNKNVLYLNNTNIYSHTYETFTASCELRLLADNKPDGGDGHYFVGKLYSCQIYDNDILIRDYIPVLDSTGVSCLYDKVGNKLYYNQGSGNFITGDIVENANRILRYEYWKQVA